MVSTLPVHLPIRAREEKVKEKVKEKQGSLGKRRAKTQSKSERNVLGVFAVRARAKRREG